MLAANVHANALDRSDLVTSDPGRRHAEYLHQIAVAYSPWNILLFGGAASARERRYCPPCTVRSWTQKRISGVKPVTSDADPSSLVRSVPEAILKRLNRDYSSIVC